MPTAIDEIRLKCENSLKHYAKWISPERYYGELHEDMFDFIQYDKSRAKCCLVPRDHQKSWCAAVTASWWATIWPWTTINYVSWSDDLVIAQLTTIESIMKSQRHRDLWPDHLNFVKERGQIKHKPKGIWSQKNKQLDHPEREKRMVRDPTFRGATAKGGNTGMHSEITIFDDLVTDENWKSESGKKDVLACYKSFSKVNSTNSRFLTVGTRYSSDDFYSKLIDQTYQIRGKEVKRWSLFERVVENSILRDGTGEFVWPKMLMPSGEEYGFDEEELAIKKSDNLIDGDIGLYYGQYYNDPTNDATKIVSRDCFKYLDKKFLSEENNQWYYKDKRLNLYAAADLAWTDKSSITARRSDYTALAVIGVDEDGYIYVLDLKRFKTDQTDVYYNEIIELYDYYRFNKIVIETNSAGKFIKQYLEDEIRRNGGRLEVVGKTHVSHEGKKAERIAQVLHHRYKNGSIYHSKGKYTRELEEEIQTERPPHDDLKDVLALAISQSVSPLKRASYTKKTKTSNVLQARFGGKRKRRQI